MAKATLLAVLLTIAAGSSAEAAEWQYDPATDMIWYGSVPIGQWYGDQSAAEAGTHQHSIRRPPDCPHRLCGYPLPIYKAPTRWPATVARASRIRLSEHAGWCAVRYRSYEVRTDTYQPYGGPRRACISP